MRITSSIQFYVRASKANRSGLSPLECSVTICGQRKFINLPYPKFKASEFNAKKPKQEVIEALDLWRNRINEYMMQMMREGMVITAETLREVIANGGVKAYTVGTLFDDYLRILQKRVGVDLKPTVYRKYEIVVEKALKFVRRDADVSALTPSLMKTIEVSWKAVYDPATVCGYLTRLKTFIKYGMDNGKITINPFQGIRITKPIKPIKSLSEDEVMNLLGRSYDGRLQRVLDLFLIQCGTGMAYTDLMDFRMDDLKQEGGHYYINKERNKTGKTFTAVVFPFAVPIILHYKTLPRITNQVYNRYLKEIDTRLTTHMGRRTYATMLVNRGVDMSVVASALGDNVEVASRYYARVFTSTILQQQISKL